MGGWEETPEPKTIRIVPEGTPTQIAHPWRAVLRTIVVWVVGLLVAFVARTWSIDLTEFSDAMVDSITTGVWFLATSVSQYLITQPWVENFFIRFVPFLATGVHTEKPKNR